MTATTAITAYPGSFVSASVSVNGVDTCGGSGPFPQYVNLFAESCSFLEGPYPFASVIDMDDLMQVVPRIPSFITSVTEQPNDAGQWGATFHFSGLNNVGQPTTDWCVTDTDVIVRTNPGPNQPTQGVGGTLFLPFTIVYPSVPEMGTSTVVVTGASISIPSFFPTFPGLFSSSTTPSGPGFTFPFVFLSSSTTPSGPSFTQFHVFSTLTVPGSTGVSTDWAVLSVSLTPSTPQEGDQVSFSMQMAALSSSAPFPQSVDVECTVDGMSCGGGSVSYAGPGGVPATVTASTPWTATPGTHTLTWSLSTTNDPDPGNNVMSTTFTVGSPAQTTILASTPTTPVVTEATVSPQTPTQTLSTNTTMIPSLGVVITVNQATPASPSTQASPSPIGTLSQTDLLLIGAVIVLVALLAVVMLRRRKSSGPATGQGPATDAVFCSHCGTQNPNIHQFCEKCGAKL